MVMVRWFEVALPLGVSVGAFLVGIGLVRKPWRPQPDERDEPDEVDELAIVDAYNRALFSGLQPGEMATFVAVATELDSTPKLVREVIARRWRS